jgi:hypothetical protein
MKLNLLAADPIPDTDYIRKTLAGLFSEEFIDLCCKKFVPGRVIKFDVYFNDEGKE